MKIGRRAFISLSGSALICAPRLAFGLELPTAGFLHNGSVDSYVANAKGFAQGLREAGFAEAENLAIAYRFANGRTEDLPALAAELVGRGVALIVADGARAAIAAKAATSSIPIVFVLGNDATGLSLAANLDRPGSNATGVTFTTSGLATRKLALLRELIPHISSVGYLGESPQASASNVGGVHEIDALKKELQAAADLLGWRVVVAEIGADRGYAPAFATFAEWRIGALVVAPSEIFANDADDIINLATIHEIPAIYPRRADVVGGGLMSYGARQPEAWRMGGTYVGQILKGAVPAHMAVLHAAAVETVISRVIAKTLDLTLSPELLGLVDEVIE